MYLPGKDTKTHRNILYGLQTTMQQKTERRGENNMFKWVTKKKHRSLYRAKPLPRYKKTARKIKKRIKNISDLEILLLILLIISSVINLSAWIYV